MKKIKNESGRSMVEMLGVLAIIGVLSIGGIYGYQMAMTKNEVNNFINDVKLSLWQFKGVDTKNWKSLSNRTKDIKYKSDLLKKLKEMRNSHLSYYVITDEFVQDSDDYFYTWNEIACPGCICLDVWEFDLNEIGNPSYFNELKKEVNQMTRFGSDPAIWIGDGWDYGYYYIKACTPSKDGYVMRAFDTYAGYNGDDKPSL